MNSLKQHPCLFWTTLDGFFLHQHKIQNTFAEKPHGLMKKLRKQILLILLMFALIDGKAKPWFFVNLQNGREIINPITL